MSLLEFSNLAFGYTDERVITDASGALHAGNIIGLIGANGGGKSTLIRLLLGQLAPEEGQVQVARGARVAYVAQEVAGDDSEVLFDHVRGGRQDRLKLEAELAAVSEQLGAVPDDEALLRRLAELEEQLSALGGHQWEHEVERLLSGLSFRHEDFTKPLGALSGGQRQKASLARQLLSGGDCFIFDEPTNHLDLEAQAFFVDYIRGLGRSIGVLLVSHDRWLLDALATHIWELDAGVLYRYPGNYTKYVPLREERRHQQRLAFEKQQEEIARTEEYIRRNLAGQNTKQAQGRRKLLARMERLERPQDDPQLRFIMEPKLVTGEQLLMVENLAFGYKGVEPVASNAPTHVSTTPPKLALNPPLAIARSQATDGLLFDGLGFQLFRGERLGITGPNGCGKTTLLKLLGRLLAPVRGMIAWGANAELGIYSQDSIDLHPDNDAMSELRSVEPRINDSDARDYLGRFGFSGDDVFQPVHSLSGGERSRLSLAKVFRRRPNVLLLDEPTNHLDIYAREGLEQFLTGYRGSIVMVTHDRRLLERICDRIVAFEQQAGRDGALTTSVSFFRGSYGDYRQWLAGRGTAAATDNGSRSAVSGSGRANPDDPASLSLYDIEALARDNRTSPAGYINKQRERYLRAAEKLEDAIAALEKQGDTLRSEMEQAAEQQEYTTLAELQARLDDLTAESEAMFDKLEIELGQAEAWEKLATEQGISL